MPKRAQPISPRRSLHHLPDRPEYPNRQQQDEQRIQPERCRDFAVQQPMGRTQPAASGTLPTGERVKQAMRVKSISFRGKEKEHPKHPSNAYHSKPRRQSTPGNNP